MYLTWPRMLWMYGPSWRYSASYCAGVIRVEFGSFCRVSQRSRVIPWFFTRSSRTFANFGTVPLLTSRVPPCQVMLIVVPVVWASFTVRTNDCIRSGSVNARTGKKMRENSGWSDRIFLSMSTTFSSVTPTSRLICA
jgi:hypothetical protein